MRKSYLNLIVLIASFLGFLLLPTNGSGVAEIIFSFGFQVAIFMLSAGQIWQDRQFDQPSWAWPTALFSGISSGILAGVYFQTTDLSFIIPFFERTILSGFIFLSTLTLLSFTNNGQSSFASSNKLFRWQIIYGIILGVISLAISYQNNKTITWLNLEETLICISASGIMLWYFSLRGLEQRLTKTLPHDKFTLFINGKLSHITDNTVLETLQSIKTISFAKRYLLTDGQVIFQEVNHRATMLENTVLSTFYALFKTFDPKIAATILERLGDGLIDITFESTEIHEDSISATDEFGVKYMLGGFSVAKEFTQDDSYTYYLTRGYTLFAKLRFADSVIAEQRLCMDEFNFKPMNTVCISDESYAACAIVTQELGLDKSYPQLNTQEQANLLGQLDAKAPTAYVGFEESLCQRPTLGFLIKQGDAVTQLNEIWSFFRLARLVRNMYRGLNYWLFTVVVIGTPLLLFWKVNLVWVVLGSTIVNGIVALLFQVVITLKSKK